MIKLYFILLAFMSVQTQHGELTIQIAEVENKSGNIKIALFDNEVGFPDKGRVAFKRQVLSLEEARKGIVFSELKPGFYAFTIFHDENNNGELDVNFFRYPVEAYGISNYDKPLILPPSWNDALFEVKAGKQVKKVKLFY